ncbi:cytochrome c biogenesis protein CcmE [Candidatus Entotheonella serta]|nr:cytochrome c biogenesis protein CcmE [Candidatus Entotheonella serta]
MSKQHIKLAIGAVIVVAAIGYLMFSGSSGNTAFFMTVPELQAQTQDMRGAPLRVAGKVTEDPIHWDVQQLSLAFTMGEGEARIPVRYKGVKPDMFQAGAEVIVEGQLGPDGVLQGNNLMTSCPSKYEEEKQRKKEKA